ncbi:hypothetical protein MGA5115_02575 [Marinomonas gallaica]|uniref:Membrane-bound lysozyme-inhibitor of c-type lysozyme n=2 Tax=Marinomonas gallaica TaxID=1806667 RepID=A0A1C3JT86_9GAMM|nr:hypothetical protein MGA5115_02575 [Marinomonas gallaica]SBT22646.1 hypothetical protein MGA5116_03269 [Marinomonas gallaica]
MKQLLCFVSMLLIPPASAYNLHPYIAHKTITYRCENLLVMVAFEPAEAHLLINHFSYVLHLTRPSTGSVYVGDILSFRDQGENATLIYRNDRQLHCSRLSDHPDA